MSSSIVTKVLFRVGVTIVGLCIAIALLLPILAIGDPRADSSAGMRAGVVWLSLIMSVAAGSLAVASSLSLVLSRDKARGQLIVGGAVLAFSVMLFLLAFVFIRSDLLLMSAPVSLIGVYVGVALVVLGFRSIRQRGSRST